MKNVLVCCVMCSQLPAKQSVPPADENNPLATEQLYHFHKKLRSKHLLIPFDYDPVRIRTKLSVFDTAFQLQVFDTGAVFIRFVNS